MIESPAQDIPSLASEALARTSRVWFRSPSVALGLLSPPDEIQVASTLYWRWDRERNKFKILPLSRDRRLFPFPDRAPRILGEALSVLSYKPESRLVLKTEAKGESRLKKIYSPATFACYDSSARLFSLAYAKAGMRLRAAQPNDYSFEWEWIEGRRASSAEIGADAAAGLSLSEGRVPTGTKPCLNPIRIHHHVEERLQAHSAWIPLTRPSRETELAELKRVWEGLGERLLDLNAPESLRIVHGDFRRRNVRIGDNGNLRLCDADHANFGEWEWDLAAWTAESTLADYRRGRSEMEFFSSLPAIRHERLAIYHDVWSLLFRLKSIEDCKNE